MKLSTILISLTAILLFSCSKEEFGANKVVQSDTSPQIWHKTSTTCSNFTLIKPAVDFLFLWDNSSSQLFTTDETKAALNNTINLISSNFDYRIVLAPLQGSGLADSYLIAENPNGLSNSALNRLVPQDQASNKLSTFPTVGGSGEHGLERAVELLNLNLSDGVFRKNSYTAIVLMSNEDDVLYTGRGDFDGPSTDAHITSLKNQLISIRDNTSKSLLFRFISLVAHSNCGTGFKANYSYKKMSKLIYETPYTGGITSPTDQSGEDNPDSYNICGMNFLHLFDGINSSIQDTVIKHVYNYWPIAPSGSPVFDINKVQVSKSSGGDIPMSSTNGFTVLPGIQNNHNTRLLPNPGEPYSGWLLELHGSSNYVTYPECLIVKTQAPIAYYGYVHLHSKPNIDSIELKINDVVVPKDTTNGWEYIGYSNSQNIKIISPTDDGPASPVENKTGYFLKLRGTAVYGNGSKIEVIYDPSI